MNLAKLSANGQITVPIEICRALNLKEGDKLLFFKRENGDIVVNNVSINALNKAQEAFAGLDISEEDILAEVMKIRYGEDRP